MIFRDGNRIIIELPDEAKAEALLWILTQVSLETVSPLPSQTHKSVRPSERQLASLESQRLAQRSERTDAEKLVLKNRGPVFPWRT